VARKQTPAPESRFIGGGAFFILLLSAPVIIVYVISGWWWLVFFLLPLLLYLLHKVYGLLLLMFALFLWRSSPIRAVLVYSDSPNWKEYIESEWLPRLGEQVVILNWSQRNNWQRSLPVLLFHYFCLNEDTNFNPSLILLRGIKYPHVYRYFYAFRDAKHGHPQALKRLETHMYRELGHCCRAEP